MAIINTLREKMGKLLVVVVGFSILAFVLTDFLSQNSSLFGNSRNVGVIDGEEVSQEVFATYVQNATAGYGATTPQFTQLIRDNIWNSMIANTAYANKLNELGLEIGNNERVDMVQGKNISQSMNDFFMRNLGSNDVQSIKNFLSQLNLYDPRVQAAFANAEQQAMFERTIEKFENMLAKTEYATLADAQKAYQEQLAFANVDYLYVPYATVTDAQIGEITDAEIRSYLSDNADDFKVDETRDIDYVSFPVIPSSEDSAGYLADVESYKRQLMSSDNDSTYASSITEQGVGFATYDPTALPLQIADNLSSLKVGDVVGPELTNGIYTLHKLSGIVPTDSEFARASQIVFNTAGMSAAEVVGVRQTANSVLRRARNGESFGDLAREFSQGAYNNVGGDMGWIKKGDTKSADIESAVFGTTRKGIVRRLVETSNNIYIVNVTEPKIKNRYKVAQIIVELTPSQSTIDMVYRQAGLFASNAKSINQFDDYVSENGYTRFSGVEIDRNAISIGRMNNARQIVSWLYGEASIGDVKDFDLDTEYVVAVYRNKTDEGTKSIDAARSEITEILKKEKKAEYIMAKLNGLSGSISEMAKSYGNEAILLNNPSLKLADNSLPNAGIAPEAIGATFALNNAGEKTAPYKVDNQGVVVVELKSKSAASEIGDYTSYENQLIQEAYNIIKNALRQSVIDRVEVVDERYKFY
ncbi:peptidylprolyl isomerase [Roseivirga sp.]|uniref:peptidylprolyl isomerase n=1 Tax=Roseivirga sp. TaxID=1964215 RepID=UPI003B8A9F85